MTTNAQVATTVSPGLRSRPSLSAALDAECGDPRAGVAGTTVPAFVERVAGIELPSEVIEVSPGLRSRPSLSG